MIIPKEKSIRPYNNNNLLKLRLIYLFYKVNILRVKDKLLLYKAKVYTLKLLI
jgi:hypothetical protein